MIAQILFVPLLLILGGVLALVFAFYAYAEHPLYGLAILGLAFAALVVIARWEYERAKRGLPPPEEVDWLDPRNR